MAEMKAQGVDPSNYMNEMMADKEIMELFMKPHVTEALMEIQKNPQSAVNYMADPDVSKLMSKMMQIQSKVGGGVPPMGGMPGMPDLAAASGTAAGGSVPAEAAPSTPAPSTPSTPADAPTQPSVAQSASKQG
jgi:STI1 domain